MNAHHPCAIKGDNRQRQTHMQKIVHFPFPQRYSVTPCLDGAKLLAHIVAGLMLFPGQKDEQNFRSYICLGIDAVFNAALDGGLHPQEAFASLLEVVSPFFAGKENNAPCRQRHAAIWKQYQYALREARFPVQGKGSIVERFVRGQLAGLLVNAVLLGGLGLTKAAEEVERQWPEVKALLPGWRHNAAPTMTATNLMQNVWPVFRTVGHLWAALHDFDLDEQLQGEQTVPLDLAAIKERATVMLPPTGGECREYLPLAVWPSRYTGIMALLFKANHILAASHQRGPLKQSSTPLLPVGDCWQIVLTE